MLHLCTGDCRKCNTGDSHCSLRVNVDLITGMVSTVSCVVCCTHISDQPMPYLWLVAETLPSVLTSTEWDTSKQLVIIMHLISLHFTSTKYKLN